jgi:flavodoxin
MKIILSTLIAGIILWSGNILNGEENTMTQNKKILIVYYSKTGRTERAAKDVAAALHADIEKLVDQKNRNGFFAFFTSGRDAMKKRKTELGPLQKDPANYDLVVLCTPVWGWNITPAIRTYMDMNKGKFKNTAYLITAGGTTADKVVPFCEEVTGQKPIAYVGFVDKELKDNTIYQEKVAKFIEDLKK